ncbi:NAD(P)-binding domain-containing protein [Streptomyces sp. ISL-96]|uniref:lactate/malate family dehydrogenase n=1 Tax=Streptomyces sp. ISL-96 TaxID=2819191 RepID=UPI001BE89259|nr:NAD(P)-binding domain-containing protein [Streptomyces sp. ISL-96]MBT2491700.1 NAD(P)-binding domain-containing protein [Streptomyces sp. ISL-96]
MIAVGLVGAGAVGQSIGTALAASGLCSRLLLTSRTQDQARALADDLDDLVSATGARARTGTCNVMGLRDVDAIVIAVRARFTNTHSTDVRMAGSAANAPTVRGLAHMLRGYEGTVFMVTNPVDLMTRLFNEESGCTRVFGIGSNLDSARYRIAVARLLDVPREAVHGHVIGEHGDAAVICASSTTVNEEPISVPLSEVRAELISRPGRINAGIGRTRCGPAGAVLSALALALGHRDGTTELSTAHDGIWHGIPLRFTAGQPIPCLPRLDPTEAQLLDAARSKLHSAYANITPPERTS